MRHILRALVLACLLGVATGSAHAQRTDRGNAHMMMLENNNLRIAGLITSWLAKSVK